MGIKNFLKKVRDKVLDTLFPEYSCYVCGRELMIPKNHICELCAKSMRAISGNICKKCGMPIPEGNSYCDTCKSRDYAFDTARACYNYNETSGKIVMDLKYNKKKFVVPFMATEMLLKLDEFGVMPDIIIPVPVSKRRYKERGFNQAELIANEISDMTGGKIIVDCTLVEKVIDSTPQARLKGKERIENLRGAFKLTTRKSLKGKNILIIDDVFTTGSTVNEVARVLRTVHPDTINVLTFAKTVKDINLDKLSTK